jgi:hypothetical protein
MENMADHPEPWSSPFTQVELRGLWTYSDGALTVKGYRLPGGTARGGSWVLADQATGNVQGVVPPGEFSQRRREGGTRQQQVRRRRQRGGAALGW